MLRKLILAIKEVREILNVIIPITIWVKLGILKRRLFLLSGEHDRYAAALREYGFVEIDLGQFGISSDLLVDFETALNFHGAKAGRKKAFQHYYLGGDNDDSVALGDVDVVRSAKMIFLNEGILNLISAVLDGTEPNLRYLEVAERRIDNPANVPKIYSQKWHRDNGGRKVIKLFICMSDIMAEDGPMEYVRKSQRSGAMASALPCKGFGARTTPSIPEPMVSPFVEDIVFVRGKKWSAFLCDTTGVHRGGNFGPSSRRKIATAAYFYGNSSAPIKTAIND